MNKIIEMDVQRRMVAYKTTQAWDKIPHMAFTYEPDVTGFYAEFQRLRADYRAGGVSLSLNTILLKAIVEGLKAAPALNSALSFEPAANSGRLEVFEEISVDIPWLLPDGRMMTLTAFDLKEKSLREISKQILSMREKASHTDFGRLLEAAAAGRTAGAPSEGFQPKDIAGGTVTVSNLGSICQTSGAVALLEILPPQVLAVGIASVQEKPGVFVNTAGQKEIGIRKFLPMCLAFDHRALDFGDIVPFIHRMDEIFQEPGEVQGW